MDLSKNGVGCSFIPRRNIQIAQDNIPSETILKRFGVRWEIRVDGN